jgi:hypothetical protein
LLSLIYCWDAKFSEELLMEMRWISQKYSLKKRNFYLALFDIDLLTTIGCDKIGFE